MTLKKIQEKNAVQSFCLPQITARARNQHWQHRGEMALHLTHGSQTTMSDDHRHMCALMAHLPRHSHAWGPSAPAWAAGPRAAGRGRDRRASQRPQQHVPHTALSRRRSSAASPRWGARRSGSLPAWRWHSRGQKDQPPLRGRPAGGRTQRHGTWRCLYS